MIIEGKHPDAGTGVFISDLQDGSVADSAGLLVGDMILSVNGEDFVGASYETAAKVFYIAPSLKHSFVPLVHRAETPYNLIHGKIYRLEVY